MPEVECEDPARAPCYNHLDALSCINCFGWTELVNKIDKFYTMQTHTNLPVQSGWREPTDRSIILHQDIRLLSTCGNTYGQLKAYGWPHATQCNHWASDGDSLISLHNLAVFPVIGLPLGCLPFVLLADPDFRVDILIQLKNLVYSYRVWRISQRKSLSLIFLLTDREKVGL